MLASITPLGERSRGFSWRLTATAFAIGAIGAGAAAGAAVAAIGSLLPPGSGWRATALLVALAVAVAFDATALRERLPTTRRQVNEDWMTLYRGWVYGVEFGAQSRRRRRDDRYLRSDLRHLRRRVPVRRSGERRDHRRGVRCCQGDVAAARPPGPRQREPARAASRAREVRPFGAARDAAG